MLMTLTMLADTNIYSNVLEPHAKFKGFQYLGQFTSKKKNTITTRYRGMKFDRFDGIKTHRCTMKHAGKCIFGCKEARFLWRPLVLIWDQVCAAKSIQTSWTFPDCMIPSKYHVIQKVNHAKERKIPHFFQKQNITPKVTFLWGKNWWILTIILFINLT